MRLARFFKQTATVWKKGSKNVYGELSYASPVLIKCRWEDIVDVKEMEPIRGIVPHSKIITDQVLDADDIVALGDLSASATPASTSRNILHRREVPSLKASQTIYECLL